MLEGVRLVADAVSAGAVPAFALVTPALDATERGAALRQRLRERAVPVFDVAPSQFARLAATQTSQGILAVVPWPDLPLPTDPDLAVVADGLRDPGNLGALLRAAAAAGVDAVALAPRTVDWTNPKVVRAAMGAHFRVPVRTLDWQGVADFLRRWPRRPRVWLADADGTTAHFAVDWRAPSVLVVGGEADGPSEEARALAQGTVRIPMPGGVESLNAATAGAVILFEAVRQRVDRC